jgi:hypothetical protein
MPYNVVLLDVLGFALFSCISFQWKEKYYIENRSCAMVEAWLVQVNQKGKSWCERKKSALEGGGCFLQLVFSLESLGCQAATIPYQTPLVLTNMDWLRSSFMMHSVQPLV